MFRVLNNKGGRGLFGMGCGDSMVPAVDWRVSEVEFGRILADLMGYGDGNYKRFSHGFHGFNAKIWGNGNRKEVAVPPNCLLLYIR